MFKTAGNLHLYLFGFLCTCTLWPRYYAPDVQELEELESVPASLVTKEPKAPKKWNFILFIAADNDLDRFARNSIGQMAKIGSTNDINVLVHLDIRNNNQKMTKWYYIEKNQIVRLNSDEESIPGMDSGDPATLIRWIEFALTHFPAEHNILIIWNHGSGTIDPGLSRAINMRDYLVFNPASDKYELDRSVEYLELITNRGICWDDSTGHFLTNQKLEFAFSECCRGPLKGKVFDIIGFDACLMGMAEIAEIAKEYAHIMIASEEVIPGTSWQYESILSAMTTQNLDLIDISKMIVESYAQTYEPIINDYTLSAIDLSLVQSMEYNINEVAQLLIECLKKQKGNNIRQTLQWCRGKQSCTHFYEPRYLDLHHIYDNIQKKLETFVFANEQTGKELRRALNDALTRGKAMIKNLVIANCTGNNLKLAKGLSIYWPGDRIHSSYRKTNFARTNAWYQFLEKYLSA